jgi:2-(1,2-epoxy-1,2-dihydrophenyl)acetyl-CoA isomerase
MEYQNILFEEIEPAIARLTLNRPHRMNAYDVRTAQECVDALGRYASDDALRVLILTGAGRGFCSGGDIRSAEDEEIAETRLIGHGVVMREGFHALALTLHQLQKPVIAMGNGPAIAGGLTLALLCDLRIASERATLGDTSGTVGLLPDEGGAWLFPRFLGLEKALRMTMFGEVYDAEEALELGLVGEVVEHDEIQEHTLRRARTLAQKAPLSVRLAKRMMVRGLESSLAQSLDDAELAVMIANASEDVQEGVRAFIEGGRPIFRGR